MSITSAASTSSANSPSSTATTAAPPPFSNIFANANSAPPATNASPVSVFGGAQPASPDQASKIFSNAAAAVTPISSANIFNSANSSFGSNQQQKTGGNIFGGSAFGSPKPETASIFGGGGASASTQSAGIFGNAATVSTSIFGGQSSAFGDAINNAQQQPSASSIFGGGPTTASSFSFNQPNLGNAFSNQSPFSGAGTGGAFVQNNAPSIAETGFGGAAATSPSSAAGGNIFGQQSAFGQSNPVFGAAPAFGAAPSFGSPKSGFGTFANVNTSPTTFGTNTAKNSLFETLGSSDTGMTFGNIAQNANVQNPSFSGG